MFLRHKERSPYELAMLGKKFIRPMQTQNRQNPNRGKYVGTEIPSLTGKLFSISSCWERESVFFNDVTPVRMRTLQDRPYLTKSK